MNMFSNFKFPKKPDSVCNLFAQKIDDENVIIKHVMYYKENGKFYEQITTYEISAKDVPANILKLIENADVAVNITELYSKLSAV